MVITNIKRPWIKANNQGKRYNPDPFYQSSEWKAIRKAKLTKDPYCECDKHKGKKVKAEMVDHIVRIKAGGSSTDPNNLQSLTNRCHARKSAKESNESRNDSKK
jgi:5-methylcytosine-specific restriction protein A